MMRIATLAASLLVASSAQAVTVLYDEAVNGDLTTEFPASPTELGEISPVETTIIRGSLDGGPFGPISGTDDRDRFAFSLSAPTLFGVDAVLGGASGIVFEAQNGGVTQTFTSVTFPTELAAGAWTFTATPEDDIGAADWTLIFGESTLKTVALPASAVFYAPILLGLGALAARRRRASRR